MSYHNITTPYFISYFDKELDFYIIIRKINNNVCLIKNPSNDDIRIVFLLNNEYALCGNKKVYVYGLINH